MENQTADDFQVACDFKENCLHCEITTSEKGALFAFYISINGKIIDKIWYSKNNSISYDLEEKRVEEYKVIFFIKNDYGDVRIKSIGRRSPWSICDGILTAVSLLAKKSDKLLEFGSGFGSKLLSNCCSVTSIEHNEEFLGAYPGVSYISTKIIELKLGPKTTPACRWYDLEPISDKLDDVYSILLVDGPSADVGRDGLLFHLDFFKSIPIWIVDDVLREKDQRIANFICLELGFIQYRFWNFSLLAKESIPSETLNKIHSKSLEVLANQSKEYIRRYYTFENKRGDQNGYQLKR